MFGTYFTFLQIVCNAHFTPAFCVNFNEMTIMSYFLEVLLRCCEYNWSLRWFTDCLISVKPRISAFDKPFFRIRQLNWCVHSDELGAYHNSCGPIKKNQNFESFTGSGGNVSVSKNNFLTGRKTLNN